MDEVTEIIKLKFEGSGIKPSKVKASEVASLINNFESAIAAIVREKHPEINKDFVLVSFEQVKSESLGLEHLAHLAKEVVMPAFFSLSQAISTGNFNDIPNKTIEPLREIQRFTKKYNCEGQFMHNEKVLANVTPATEINYNRDFILKGETIIYGEVLKAGGVTPRTTLRLSDDNQLSFEVSKTIAKQLANNLYTTIGLRGNATWDKKTYRVLEFRPSEVIVIKEQDISLSDTFTQLSVLLGKHIADKGGYNNYIN